MGWLYLHEIRTRKEMIEHLRRQRSGPGRTLINSRAIGNHHWYLVHSAVSGKTWIGLDLMQGGGSSGHGWGYKDLDESDGPCYYDCPLSYLSKASAPIGFAVEWREQVRRFHENKAALKALKPGAVVKYGAHEYRLNFKRHNGRAWAVNRISDGMSFDMKQHQINKSTIIGEPA